MNAAFRLSFDRLKSSSSPSSASRKNDFSPRAGDLFSLSVGANRASRNSNEEAEETQKKQVIFSASTFSPAGRAEDPLSSQWTQALQNATMGNEMALRAMIDEQPHMMWGGSMDVALAERLDLWAALLARPEALDTATWTLVAHKSQSSLAGHAALFSLWARAAAHRKTPQRLNERNAPSAAFVAADLLRAPFTTHQAQENFALSWPLSAGGVFLLPADAPRHRYSNPWMTLAFMAQKDAFSAQKTIELISCADFEQSVNDSYLPMLMWDPLALLLAWGVLLRKDCGESTREVLGFVLEQDVRSPRDLARDSLTPFLRGSVPQNREDLEASAMVLELLENHLGQRVTFDDTKWEALRAALTKRELTAALPDPSQSGVKAQLPTLDGSFGWPAPQAIGEPGVARAYSVARGLPQINSREFGAQNASEMIFAPKSGDSNLVEKDQAEVSEQSDSVFSERLRRKIRRI